MPSSHYRLYFLDQTGRIERAKDLLCDTLDEAIAIARGHPAHVMVELWQGTERIGSFGMTAGGALGTASDFVLYLLKGQEIVASLLLNVTDEKEAHAIANCIFRACDDGCSGFELWHGGRIIQMAEPKSAIHDLELRIQEHMVELEQRLHDSFGAIRKSRKFLSTLDGLRQRP